MGNNNSIHLSLSLQHHCFNTSSYKPATSPRRHRNLVHGPSVLAVSHILLFTSPLSSPDTGKHSGVSLPINYSSIAQLLTRKWYRPLLLMTGCCVKHTRGMYPPSYGVARANCDSDDSTTDHSSGDGVSLEANTARFPVGVQTCRLLTIPGGKSIAGSVGCG